MPYLAVNNLTKNFPGGNGNGAQCIFKNISLEMQKGEFISIIGHSGCGKSTLLNIVAGLDTPSEGRVELDGKVITGPGLDRMVVFQNFALMPWMTVFENIRVAVTAAHKDWSVKKVDDWVQKYINMVGLTYAENKKPAALSGGMRQRVGLARAFSVEPKMLLLDEPFAQIDALTRGTIQEELVRMWNETGSTVFMVTHDVDEAILLSDRILLMSAGPEAQIAESVEVAIPRPRSRSTIIEQSSYYVIRNHIIRFLVERAHKEVTV
ncbi:MAG TPA: bacitracin ABC transporter ATP-binding protein [Nitrospiraceae bacterium]|nr:MAG: bacitracin ABC transporter ATP-binding protein [Nitrospirae bacterium GWA2_46_11]OGW22747.1 MAG: bacitracin ABC transporter ATP-binding protein [Nitrospirae bacterium GWB2_47_37]HAK89759.1 bacitracin ABC transporter ATP-binding protein [Nitrospiraceae bacterium]HCZ11286.1 bacitracin ABC transporter ATP-binding protein [Nitrospiraceae bacterium]